MTNSTPPVVPTDHNPATWLGLRINPLPSCPETSRNILEATYNIDASWCEFDNIDIDQMLVVIKKHLCPPNKPGLEISSWCVPSEDQKLSRVELIHREWRILVELMISMDSIRIRFDAQYFHEWETCYNELYLMAKQANTNRPAQAYVVTQTTEGLSTHEFELVQPSEAIPLDLSYGPGFGDWSDQLVTKLSATSHGILLMFGPPGTGKTSFIRILMQKLGPKKYPLFVTRALARELGSPQLATLLLSLASKERDIVLILEDAEHMLLSRHTSDPAGADLVSLILNLTDGLLNDLCRCQVIATFNTDIKDVDSAVLRRGRLIGEREFGLLDAPTVNKLLDYLHADGVPDIKEPMALCDVLALSRDSTDKGIKTIQPTSRKVGF